MEKLKIHLIPSRIGTYYQRLCGRNLIYEAVNKEQKRKLNWNIQDMKDTTHSLAGEKWEEKLLNDLLNEEKVSDIKVYVNKSNGKKKYTYEQTVEIFKKLNKDTRLAYIYQGCVNVTTSFKHDYLARYNNADFEIEFGDMYPDFLQIEYVESKDKFKITVIDVKNADHMKINAQIQISIYAEIIRYILEDNNIDNCFVADEGVVWNKEIITKNLLANVFDMKDARREISSFFKEYISSICDEAEIKKGGAQLLESLPCKFSSQCDQCGSYDDCLNILAGKKSVRLLPYMSDEAQERLDLLIKDGTLKDDSMASVKAILESEDSGLMTEGCRYWKNIKNNLEVYCKGIEALSQDKLEKFPKKNATTITFPKWQDYALYMTAQRDPDTGRVFAYAYNLTYKKDIDLFNLGLNENGFVDKDKAHGILFNELIAENNKEELDRIDREFVEQIFAILQKIDEYNDEIENKKLQFYVMDSYERYNIENELFYMLESLDSVNDQDLLFKVMTIIFWMQGEKMVVDHNIDAQPEEEIENPISDIVSVINQLYVLSCPARYNLIGASKIFSPDYNFYDKKEFEKYYFEELSDTLNGMAIYDIWKTKDDELDKKGKPKKTGLINALKIHLAKRMSVESNIVLAIQSDYRNGIINITANATPYKMQQMKFRDNPEISRLYFENHLEELIKYHQIRSVRTKGIENAISEGTILSLEYMEDGNFKILNRDSYIGKEWFVSWICEDTPFNRTQIMLLDEKAFFRKEEENKRMCAISGNKYYQPTCKSVRDPDDSSGFIKVFFFKRISDIEPKFYDDGQKAFLKYWNGYDSFEPEVGKKYLLFEVYRDYNSPKVDRGLGVLLRKSELLDPISISGDTELVWDKTSEEECSKYWSLDRHSFSDSQRLAFIHLFNRKNTVLVGPPAAGKTDFIGRAVLTLASYYKNVLGKNLRILVSANSHSAIENILLKIIKMKLSAEKNGVKLAKVKLFKTDKFEDSSELFDENNISLIGFRKTYSGIYDANIFSEKNDMPIVVGATAWKIANDNVISSPFFDLVIIDEASQVRAMDAALLLESMTEEARILLVGDDDQLPPIISGNYPIVPNEKYIHGSIFKMFISALRKEYDDKYESESLDFKKHSDIDIVTLEDNFRMDNVLCRYSAEKIYKEYGMDYKASIKDVAIQTISLAGKSGDELLDFMLDPEYPLVFCKLSGNSINQKSAEIKIVTELVIELMKSLKNKDGSIAKEAGNFWSEQVINGVTYDGACGIISPHHEHINRVRTSIENAVREKWNENSQAYIGTVDKLQGKERTAVIVSYGVNDKETVQNEAEFIFSRNRFNVSITRGKAKTIVLLSDVIAESNIYTNIMKSQSEAIKQGIEFVQGFEEFMNDAASDEEVVKMECDYLGGDVKLTVYKKRIKY